MITYSWRLEILKNIGAIGRNGAHSSREGSSSINPGTPLANPNVNPG
jgi:hypothetical protein